MSAPWRERLKRKAPWLVHFTRSGRFLLNQVRYPVLASVLDWRQTIIGGPFAGLRYTHSGVIAYFEILGTYEQSLIPVVESVIKRKPRLIVDVGAAFGYYALGFAYRCPESRVIAYEMDQTRQNIINKCRDKNGLPNLQTYGECSIKDLNHDLDKTSGAFMLMDVEGAEQFLLDPIKVPGLYNTEIVVELHEMFVPGITQIIRARFEATHEMHLIRDMTAEKRPLAVALSPSLQRMLDRSWNRMTRETRGQRMSWLHMVPKPKAM